MKLSKLQRVRARLDERLEPLKPVTRFDPPTRRWVRAIRDALGMSVVIALILGGSQALSRSLFSQMIPRGDEAAFFAIYEISGSGTSWMGPLIFALVVAATNSYRDALLSLIALFAMGSVLLALTNVKDAFEEARA